MSRPAVYPTDVSDEEWIFVAPYLCLMREDAPQREHSLRAVFDALRCGIHTAEGLAVVVSAHKTTAREWLSGNKVPELGQFLRLLAAFGLEAVDFLSGSLPGDRLQPPPAADQPDRSRQKKWTRHPFDEGVIRPVLETALKAPPDPSPLTAEAICRRRGWVYDTGRRHLPELCRALSAKRASHLKQRKVERLAAHREEIRRAARRVHAQGLPITMNRVGTLLERSGVLRSPHARATLKENRIELSEESKAGSFPSAGRRTRILERGTATLRLSRQPSHT